MFNFRVFIEHSDIKKGKTLAYITHVITEGDAIQHAYVCADCSIIIIILPSVCLLYTSDAADE